MVPANENYWRMRTCSQWERVAHCSNVGLCQRMGNVWSWGSANGKMFENGVSQCCEAGAES
jgi:hypothetical protein